MGLYDDDYEPSCSITMVHLLLCWITINCSRKG